MSINSSRVRLSGRSMINKKRIVAVLVLALMPIASAQAQTFNSVAHVHSVKAFGDQVLIGTHEGLFRFQSQNNMKAVGAERFDTMGLTISGNTIFASGHPGKGSKLPEPVGLLRSDDGGQNWKKISLQGEVDFHFLESGKSELYGADAQTGILMHSSNAGKSWRKIGTNTYSDIAINNQKSGSAFGVQNGKIFQTVNAFATTKRVNSDFEVRAIELVGSVLYAASGNSIFQSINSGQSWKKISTFKKEIADITSSDKIIAAIVGQEIHISRDKGKTFKI